jgi:hypothetical protein
LRQSVVIELLENTRMSIDQVAERVGFADATSFRKAFKKWTGGAPSDFRSGQDRKEQMTRHSRANRDPGFPVTLQLYRGEEVMELMSRRNMLAATAAGLLTAASAAAAQSVEAAREFLILRDYLSWIGDLFKGCEAVLY